MKKHKQFLFIFLGMVVSGLIVAFLTNQNRPLLVTLSVVVSVVLSALLAICLCRL
jgi:hypothetical protein